MASRNSLGNHQRLLGVPAKRRQNVCTARKQDHDATRVEMRPLSPVPTALLGCSPHGLHLVLLLQGAQPPPHLVQQPGALEAAAAAVTLDHHGPVAAHHYRLPGHRKLLGHTLAPRGAVPGRDRPGLSMQSQGMGCGDLSRRLRSLGMLSWGRASPHAQLHMSAPPSTRVLKGPFLGRDPEQSSPSPPAWLPITAPLSHPSRVGSQAAPSVSIM